MGKTLLGRGENTKQSDAVKSGMAVASPLNKESSVERKSTKEKRNNSCFVLITG